MTAGLFSTSDMEFQHRVRVAGQQLLNLVPAYMVPSVYLPLPYLPLTTGGKADRKRLRNAVTCLSAEEVKAYNTAPTESRRPSTKFEEVIHGVWAHILHKDPRTFGVDDHFLRIGGDSINAMQVVSQCSSRGINLTVADIYQHKTIAGLSSNLEVSTGSDHGINEIEATKLSKPIWPEKTNCTSHINGDIKPFSLIDSRFSKKTLLQQASDLCHIQIDHIDDIYPCTPLQEGLMALAAQRESHFIATFECELVPNIDIPRLRLAWNTAATANPILRTRIVNLNDLGACQVVVQDLPHWREFNDLASYNEHRNRTTMQLGQPLVNLSIIRLGNYDKVYKLCIVLHHAIYDGWSLPLLWKHMREAYYNTPLNPQPFNYFIKYILNTHGAEEFWRSEFEDLNAPIFPSIPSSKYLPSPSSSFSHVIPHIDNRNSEYTMSTVIQLAWAITMASYTDSDDVVFGFTVSGRSAPVQGIEGMTGPTFATVPLRIKVEPFMTVRNSLSLIQDKTTAMIPFQQTGLQNIRLLSSQAAKACSFQCHLGIQPPSTLDDNDLFTFVKSESQDYGAFANYAFVIICHLDGSGKDNILVTANYDESIVHPASAKRIVQVFGHILRQVSQDHDLPLNKLNLVSLDDQLQLSEWNRHLPAAYDVCLHDLVLAHAVQDPTASAIAAWDGEVTYEELDTLSLQLATQLQSLGLQKGSIVPLCFSKSKWAIITMMAVLRSGGTCVPLDPASPKERLQNIFRRTAAQLVLTSPENGHVTIDTDALAAIIPFTYERPSLGTWTEPLTTPQDPAFIVFTSGSTGEAKGIIMQHAAICTSIRDHSAGMNISNKTRGLHFASYAFDASLYEIFSVLGNGGCVCVPSENDRMTNLAGFIRGYAVNLAIFAPSVINTLLQPEDVPRLQTVIVGGEALTPEIVRTWTSANVTLINGYGPAETTICAVGKVPTHGWVTGTIGPLTGCTGWITSPSDPSRLMPIGAVGELLIEGLVVTHGYLDNPKATAAAYIPAPPWLADFRCETEGRILYRTGDLVQYTENGWIKFIGRKDTQIKLRGQRIELGEVEHHVRQCFPNAREIVAEVVAHTDGARVATLVAFIYEGDAGNGERDLFASPDDRFMGQAKAARARLNAVVPAYMVPAAFLKLSRVPRTTNGKLDRRKLREGAALYSLDEDTSTAGAMRQEPKSEREQSLCSLWAIVLKIPPERIGADDDFFSLGGDSIRAMKLASMARERGLSLSVSSIFDHPVLASMAKVAEKSLHDSECNEYYPGSLIGMDLKSFLPHLAGHSWPFSLDDVEDVLPTTEFQQLFLMERNVTYIQLELPMRIDPDRLEAACHAVVAQHPVLRTVFVPYEGEYLQVVLRDIELQMVRLNCHDDLEEFTWTICRQDLSSPVPFGSPHFQPYLLSRSTSHHMFVMRTAHAQYDGASFPLILKDLSTAYNRNPLGAVAPPFALYLQFRQAQRSASAYQFWKDYLNGSKMTDLEAASLATSSTCCADEHLVKLLREIPHPSPPEGITIATLAKAAWAVVLARVTGQRDIVFGQVINGRDAPIADITNISGPCITISTIRVTIQPSWAAKDLLQHAQNQYRRAMPFSNLDFKDILKHTSVWPVDTDFSSVATHQDTDTPLTFPFNGVECSWKPHDFGVPAHFHVVTFLRNNKLVVVLGASCRKISEEAANDLITQLCDAIAGLSMGYLDLPDN